MGDELKVIINHPMQFIIEQMQRKYKKLSNSHLVKLQHVKQLKELPVLLGVLQLDVVLPQPVQGELRLVVDVHLHRLQTRDDSLPYKSK